MSAVLKAVATLAEMYGANLVVDRMADGTLVERFRPVTAAETDMYVRELIENYRKAFLQGSHHRVLLVGLFVLDLLVIHPFEDGNGRIARALTNALLSDAGYGVVRYVSLEQAIARSSDSYYQSLLDSTHGWHQDNADPWPWLGYFTGLLSQAYETFAARAAAEHSPGTKQDRVRDYVLRQGPPVFRVTDIRAALPGISDQTIRLVLTELRKEGIITADGVGRSASWTRGSLS
ncbi:Fic family protein [Microbispora sp. NPDC049125]|uniref:Fic family protein n=1 Tax=Microbispora sp. NPDC049125 TaxID=3154929 RepID=UPI003464EA8C